MRAMSFSLSQTPWPSVMCGPSISKRSMYSTAVQPPRDQAYCFCIEVSSRCMCIGTWYFFEVCDSRVSALSEHQCRFAGASWILTLGFLLWRGGNDLKHSTPRPGTRSKPLDTHT